LYNDIFYQQNSRSKMTDIRQFIKDLNETWQQGRYDDLYSFYNTDVVMLPPGRHQPVVGIEPMVESYRQFCEYSTIHNLDMGEPSIYSFNSVAVCHVPFSIDYEVESGRYLEEGMEVYCIETSGKEPAIVWRTQMTLKKEKV